MPWRSHFSWFLGDLPSLATCNLKLAPSGNHSSGMAQIAQRWHSGSDPLQLRQFSGHERATRRHKMSIQRLLPCVPPDNSAEVMQNLQIVQ
jgi:hypothetical protein